MNANLVLGLFACACMARMQCTFPCSSSSTRNCAPYIFEKPPQPLAFRRLVILECAKLFREDGRKLLRDLERLDGDLDGGDAVGSHDAVVAFRVEHARGLAHSLLQHSVPVTRSTQFLYLGDQSQGKKG
mmetsp:Transcript_12134/g.23977  ORF Transcript_12134/g.23977 Transcript_12134/m.23977 type:complete len:129 (+) Transcript_12134:110-496(+)